MNQPSYLLSAPCPPVAQITLQDNDTTPNFHHTKSVTNQPIEPTFPIPPDGNLGNLEKKKRRGKRGGKRKNIKTSSSSSTDTVKIFTLSSHALSPHEVSLLKKGLNFTPTHLPNSFTLFRHRESVYT